MNSEIKEDINQKQKNKELCRNLILILLLSISLLASILCCSHLEDKITNLKYFNNTFVFIEKGTTISGKNICIKNTKEEKKYTVYSGYRTLKIAKDGYFKTSFSKDTLIIYNIKPTTIHSLKQ